MTGKEDVIKRWIQKAEVDIKTAKILIESEDPPTESICFHAQQAVEKLLKAYLTIYGYKSGKKPMTSRLCLKCALRKTENLKIWIQKNWGISHFTLWM